MSAVVDDDERETEQETGIREITQHDVLLGRGAACWNHIGNRRFREIVAQRLQGYESCKSRIEKMVIVSDIADVIVAEGGRFLKQDPATKTWFTVERKCAIEKVGHAIRDKRALEQKREHKEMLSTKILLQETAARARNHSANLMQPAFDPMPPSTLLEQRRNMLLDFPSNAGSLTNESRNPGWHRSLEQSMMAAAPRGGRTGGFEMLHQMDSIQGHAIRRLQSQMVMEQSNQQFMNSAAMSSIRKTEEALAHLRKRAEITRNALRAQQASNDHRELLLEQHISPNSYNLDRFGVDSRLLSSYGRIVPDNTSPSSLVARVNERGFPLALGDDSFHQLPQLVRPGTRDPETQAALQTLQATLGDKGTADAIRQASLWAVSSGGRLQDSIPGARSDLGRRMALESYVQAQDGSLLDYNLLDSMNISPGGPSYLGIASPGRRNPDNARVARFPNAGEGKGFR